MAHVTFDLPPDVFSALRKSPDEFAEEMRLVYQHGPEGFYRRLGFLSTGEYNEDEVVAERIFSPGAAPSS